jgi:cytochrome c-type biogenesis protein CcmF
MGIGPLARWKQASLPELAVLLRWALAVSLVLGLLLPFAMGTWKPMVGFGLVLALFIFASSLVSFRKSLKQSRAHYGMVLAHIGVAVFVVGVTLVKGYDAEKDASLREGDTVELAPYAFRLEQVVSVTGPNYRAAQAKITVSKDGRAVTTLYPERRIYTVQKQVMTEAAINTGFTRDLYVSLGDPVEGNAWLVRVQYKPFVDWIWGGCLIMGLGGLLAASDRRYRFSVRKQSVEDAVTVRA